MLKKIVLFNVFLSIFLVFFLVLVMYWFNSLVWLVFIISGLCSIVNLYSCLVKVFVIEVFLVLGGLSNKVWCDVIGIGSFILVCVKFIFVVDLMSLIFFLVCFMLSIVLSLVFFLVKYFVVILVWWVVLV